MSTQQLGREELAVASLLHTTRSHHNLKSAFTRSAIPGVVYIEGSLGAEGLELLAKTPGVIVGRTGVRRYLVEPDDYVKALSTKNIETNVKKQDWVIIKGGLYKGDVGLICRVHGWGATVLLVPRLHSELERQSNKKRKATFVRPSPCLFDPVHYNTASNLRARKIDTNTYTIGRLVLQYGLLSKEYEFSSFKGQPPNLAHTAFHAFESSGHPCVQTSASLRPREWCFAEGDRVYDRLSKRHGNIESMTPSHIEVDFGEEGLGTVSWRHVLRTVSVGDTVTVTTGIHAGVLGWVVLVQEHMATVIARNPDEPKVENGLNVRSVDIAV